MSERIIIFSLYPDIYISYIVFSELKVIAVAGDID